MPSNIKFVPHGARMYSIEVEGNTRPFFIDLSVEWSYWEEDDEMNIRWKVWSIRSDLLNSCREVTLKKWMAEIVVKKYRDLIDSRLREVVPSFMFVESD